MDDKRAALRARLMPPDGAGTSHSVGGVEGLLFGQHPPGCVFLHGGGYVMGSPSMQARLATMLARELEQGVFAPAYPLAPEHVWPAQIDAVLAVLDALPNPVALAGSSAGGHLALNAALRRPDCIRALALFSPNTDRTGRSHTRAANTPLDAMNSDEGDRALFRMAMPEADADSAEASPLLADLSGVAPVFLSASAGEVLLGDTLLLARALETAGVEVTTRIADSGAAGFHMFESWPHILLDGAAAIADAGAFLREHV